MHAPFILDQDADRLRGVKRAAQTYGLDPQRAILDITVRHHTSSEGEASVATLLRATDRPTAIFCANDLLALGMMRGLEQRGIAIPDDIAVVGYDDDDFASMLSPSLTTVRLPKYQLGHKATELLLEEICHAETHLHQQISYQPELIVRESSTKSPPHP